ncbi:MAG: hypothetical protein ABIV47_03305 [Roseiflexaceae bacterium]
MAQSHEDPDRRSTSGTPRWVKVFGIIVLVVVLLFVISLLAGGQHGPGLHTPSGDSGGWTALAVVRDDDALSAGGHR